MTFLRRSQFIATALGIVFLAGMVALLVLAVQTGMDGSGFRYFVPGLLGGALLITAGRLPGAGTVREWYGVG